MNSLQNVTVKCKSSCALNVGEADDGWQVRTRLLPPAQSDTKSKGFEKHGACCVGQVFGFGPFRADSSVCKAAFFAGVIGEDGGVATLTFGGRVSSRNAGQAVLADALAHRRCYWWLKAPKRKAQLGGSFIFVHLKFWNLVTNLRAWRLLLTLVYLL